MAKKPNLRKILRNLSEGRNLRDDGIDVVMAGEDAWKLEVFVKVILKLPPNWRGIGEDIRVMAHAAGVASPHHPNCWGGYIAGLIKAGYLSRLPTVPPRQMKVPKSHARHSQMLERF